MKWYSSIQQIGDVTHKWQIIIANRDTGMHPNVMVAHSCAVGATWWIRLHVATAVECITTKNCPTPHENSPVILHCCLSDVYQIWWRHTVTTRMWANAQRDGRPAEYRWRPLFNAAKFGWRPLLECRAVTLPRRKSRWNLQGCPKLANRSQPLVGQKFTILWGHVECLTSFFPIVDTCLSSKDTARQSGAMVPKWRFFASCIFSEPRAAGFRHAF